MRRTICVLALTTVAACGGDDAAVRTEVPNGPVTADSIAQRAAVSVTVSFSEWKLDLSPDTVPAGLTQFTLVNRGEYTHGFIISGNGFQQRVDNIVPGTQTVLTIDLRQGTYELSCPVSDPRGVHSELGMTAQLTVR